MHSTQFEHSVKMKIFALKMYKYWVFRGIKLLTSVLLVYFHQQSPKKVNYLLKWTIAFCHNIELNNQPKPSHKQKKMTIEYRNWSSQHDKMFAFKKPYQIEFQQKYLQLQSKRMRERMYYFDCIIFCLHCCYSPLSPHISLTFSLTFLLA